MSVYLVILNYLNVCAFGIEDAIFFELYFAYFK